MDFDWETLHHDGDMSLIIALKGQELIGWTGLCQGFYHKEWARVQSRYYRRMGTNTRKMNIGRWKKMFSIILTDYSLDCWKSRNESIHGKEQDISRKKILIPYVPRYGAYMQGRENFMDIQTKRSLICHW